MVAKYVPKKEDFVFASDQVKKGAVKEAVSGVKHETLKRFMAQRSAVFGAVILVLLILLSLVGPYISGHSYDEQNLSYANMAPRVPLLSGLGIFDGSEDVPKTSGTITENKYETLEITDTYYLFGTDSLGRDMFARCFMGLRISLIIAFAATMINLIIGMNYGIVSGYFGGATDLIMQRFIDIISSIPTLVVVTLLMLVLQPGMGSIIVALMVSGWFEMSLIARAEVLKVKELEYVQAAKTMGAGHMHIIFKDIVPNIVGKLVTQIMLSIPQAVFLEAFLSFVGLGMPAGTCSLGTLLSDGFKNAMLHPYKLLPAAIIMILLMVGCHMVAEGVKKATE
ncbi:MAG: ABC transporter permease [Lachnospiraceae bacterium]|nr:ABC transporter permease [Lachnospiraceae bacterium]